jgi:hypothetical protein
MDLIDQMQLNRIDTLLQMASLRKRERYGC